jgi:DNA helicase IV
MTINFSCGKWGALFADCDRYAVFINDEFLLKQTLDGVLIDRIETAKISDLSIQRGFIWCVVEVNDGHAGYLFKGLLNNVGADFVDLLKVKAQQKKLIVLENDLAPILLLSGQIDAFFAQDRYLSRRLLTTFLSTISATHLASLPALKIRLGATKLLFPERKQREVERLDHVLSVLHPPYTGLAQRNDRYVDDERQKFGTFFETVEKTALNREQEVAAVTFENANLLVAAAGSGKSSTVVGKIGYALSKGLYAPDEIVALAFNADAKDELNARIATRLKPYLNGFDREIASTFHALGKSIASKVAGKTLFVETKPKPLIEEVVQRLRQTNDVFGVAWVTFLAIWFQSDPDSSRWATPADYEQYLAAKGASKGKNQNIETIQGEFVRSMQEAYIANWLFMQGVEYKYEQAYEYSVTERGWSKYEPDFYYPNAAPRPLYHEHFGIDKNGVAPAFLGKRYAADVESKRRLHAECNTPLMETHSAHFYAGNVFTLLHDSLLKHGVPMKPRSVADVLDKLKLSDEKQLINLVSAMIGHVKESGATASTIRARVGAFENKARAVAFLAIFVPILDAYNAELERQGKIDFPDMIRKAADAIESAQYVHPYKLILVDEFQDMSAGRGRLIRALLKQHPDCVLFGVGDDWQSINGYAGADIAIMRDFEKHFGASKEMQLTETYRYNAGIAAVSSLFIQANPLQKRKSVVTKSNEDKHIIQMVTYDKTEQVVSHLEQTLAKIADQTKAVREIAGNAKAKKYKSSVFILSRYRLDYLKIIAGDKVVELQALHAEFLDIRQSSVHGSKGLEADHVFVLGLNHGKYAFPSEMMNDPLFDLVLPDTREVEDAEERRLFYVALTRARHRVTLYAEFYATSSFGRELLLPLYQQQVAHLHLGEKETNGLCTGCKFGFLVKRESRYGLFWGCSRYPACEHTRNLK